MAKRLLLSFAFTVLAAAGCHSTRPPKQLPMMAPAPLNDAPRPKAEAAPRGKAGDELAIAPLKRVEGFEEASADFPTAPKETFQAPKVELPPAPISTPVTPPPGLPGVPMEMPPSPIVPRFPTPMQGHIQLVPDVPTPPTGSPPALPQVGVPPALPQNVITAPTSNLLTPSLGEPTPPKFEPKQRVEATPTSFIAPQAVPAPIVRAAAGDDLPATLRALHEKAQQTCSTMTGYEMRIRRREVVNGRQRPEELLYGRFRTTPFSFYFKWLGEQGKGREVVYVQGKFENKLHTLLAAGDMPFMAGKVFSPPIDSPFVKSNCRYPVTDAGLATVVARFGRLTSAIANGESREGTAKYLGKVKRPEFEEPVEAVVQTLPAKYDALFPSGGERQWYFDVKTGLPVLGIAFDHTGREVEYYCHDRILVTNKLDDDDFNPQKLGKTK